jgi:cytochrome P450
MMLYPDVQRKLHAELDELCGKGRIPSMSDITSLKYFNAAWNESMRWNATTPLGKNIAHVAELGSQINIIGVPHTSAEDDIWNGYYIPKGTIIHCNIGYVPSIFQKKLAECSFLGAS